MTARDDFDPLAPQREAAFFYGLFLRGQRRRGDLLRLLLNCEGAENGENGERLHDDVRRESRGVNHAG